MDSHGGQYTFARMIDPLGSQPPQSLSPEAFIDFLKKQLALAQRVVMVYEAGPYGFSLYRQARELGVECLVCAPERLSRGRKRANDKIDARELLSRLDREIGDWNRFHHRRQVASSTELCPGEDSSGDRQMSLSIDKHGNPRVRAVLVECAWLLPRFPKDYRPLQRWKWVFEAKSKCGKALRKKAAVDLWRLKTGRARAEDLGLKLSA